MSLATLDTALDALILKAAKALEHTLDTSERETARVSAALGILRLAERSARRAEARDKRTARSNDRRRRADTPAPAAPPSTDAPAPSEPPPESPPAPEADAAIVNDHPAREPDPAPEPAALTPDEIAELRRYFTVLEPTRFHDPALLDYWRSKLRMGRRWAHERTQPPDGS